MANTTYDTDVFIAGGGPAGLVAAIAARRRGLNVIVADRATPSIDKACGEGLMPDALSALASLDVHLPLERGHLFHGIRFLGNASSVEARFPAGVGVGIRRTILHASLVAAAEEAGVTLLWQTPVVSIDGDTVTLPGHVLRARFIVGADGENSSIRRWSGLDTYKSDDRRYGFRRHYRLKPWTDVVEVHWAEGCQLYITPVAADQVCVALISRAQDFRLEEALGRFPEVAARLRGAQTASPERGALSASRRLQRVTAGPVALIGDASGSVDAVTGEGMCLAFRQAVALAAALEVGDLSRYQAEYDGIRRGPAMMADLLLLLDRRSSIRRRVFSAFSARPEVFSQMLALHVGDPSYRVLASTLLYLGWGMISA